MKRFLNEPILHFAVIGALLFVAYILMNPESTGEDPYTISFGEHEIAPAIENFRRNNDREPSAQELKELTDMYVLEELFFREAIALGMKDNDPAVKRLLALRFQEFIKDQVETYSPGEDSLESYLATHPNKFSDSKENENKTVILAEWKKEYRSELKELIINDLKAKYRVVPDSRKLQELLETSSPE